MFRKNTKLIQLMLFVMSIMFVAIGRADIIEIAKNAPDSVLIQYV